MSTSQWLRPTKSWWESKLCHSSSTGSRIPLVNQNTRCFFGDCCMTGSIPETFWEEKLSIWPTTTVMSTIVHGKKLFTIFSGPVLLQLNVGTWFALQDRQMFQFWKLFLISNRSYMYLFMEIIILASWAIWISSNNLIFQAIQPSVQRWKAIFLEELNLLRFRIKKSYARAFCTWLDNLVL